MRRARKLRNRQNYRGGSLAELGPALWVLLFGLFFPLLCLISFVFSYAAVLVLNNSQVREAALLPYKEAQSATGAVRVLIPFHWRNGGLGSFVNPIGLPDTDVSYRTATKDANGFQDYYVVVRTSCRIRSLLNVPLFGMKIPGLNSPVPVEITSESLVENYKNAPGPDSPKN